MKTLRRFTAALAIAAILCSSLAAQTAQDPVTFVKAQPLGNDIEVWTHASTAKSLKGAIVKRNGDTFVLQPYRRGAFAHWPKSIEIAYTDVARAAQWNSHKAFDIVQRVYLGVAIVFSVVGLAFLINLIVNLATNPTAY